MSMKKNLYLIAIVLMMFTAAQGADVASIFTKGMVLQREMPVPVWGTGKPDEEVTVKFAGQEKSCKVGPDGRWMVKLDPLMASAEPRTLTVQSAAGKTDLTHVLVGEVWIASGQSNMNYWMYRSAKTRPLIDKANDPQLRLLQMPYGHSDKPLTGFRGHWNECTSKNVNFYSAVGYIFGREIRSATQVPVGIIQSTVGGTPAEAWTSRAALEADPALKKMLNESEEALKIEMAKAEVTNKVILAKHDEAVAKAKAAGSRVPRSPRLVDPSANGTLPYRLYNAMIAPLVPFACRGVIWYQGESNSSNPELYRTLFPSQIKDWRTAFGQDFPFLFVQIAPCKGMPPELRDAQLHAWRTVTNTAMVVITDHGEAKNIHPENKEPVGIRLALAARALAYGEKIVYSGPVFDKLAINGNQAVLTFQHVGDGLVAKGDKLTGFEISGGGTNFVAATAIIKDDTVIVTSEAVKAPVAVRFGWSQVPDGNLFNKNGLPATPFRTDNQ
jgi:sialate O-acetylesterase